MKKLIRSYIKYTRETMLNDTLFLTGMEKINLLKSISFSRKIIDNPNQIKNVINFMSSESGINEILVLQNNKNKSDLKKLLHTIDPYSFEHLVEKLFNAMGYKTEITKRSNDLGVDIITNITAGITSTKVVIQVKRYKQNIHRPALDQLRGVIPLHKAEKGILVTLSGFSKGCHNAVPEHIKLIDGDQLIELLFEYEIGFKPIKTRALYMDTEFLKNLDQK